MLRHLKIDDSTYDEFAARWRVNRMKERIRAYLPRTNITINLRIYGICLLIYLVLAVVDLLTDIIR
jgi:hypothetical protein